MDLGIRGKRALVCGSSKGLGLGCATALAEAGVNIIMNASCLLYTSPSPRDRQKSRMPSSA